MLGVTGVISAEAEEEDFRVRNVHLAEKEFLPLDEAFEVFSPLDPDLAHHEKGQLFSLAPIDPDGVPPYYSAFNKAHPPRSKKDVGRWH